jgi:hypothetical protein
MTITNRNVQMPVKTPMASFGDSGGVHLKTMIAKVLMAIARDLQMCD